MAFDLLPDDRCLLAHRIEVDGKAAFQKGDLVTIREISPDPLRPGFKYLVHSESLDRDVRLRGIDLERTSCPRCGYLLTASLDECPSCGWISSEKERFKIKEDMRKFRRSQSDRSRHPYGPTWFIGP